MALDRHLAYKKLTSLLKSPQIPLIPVENERYVLFSDWHLGDGGKSDDFYPNEKALLSALNYYNQKHFHLVLVGDIEEFWQFSLEEIKKRYNSSIYKSIKKFGDSRVIRIFGNHDIDWFVPEDPIRNKALTYPVALEAIKLQINESLPLIFIVHGHQGSKESDKYKYFSRFAVKIFRYVEPLAKFFGIYTHPSASRSRVLKNYEYILYQWAKKSNVILIAGHSHRAIFASSSYYDELKEKIISLQKKMENISDKEKIIALQNQLLILKSELKHEKSRGRDIVPLEKHGKAKPFYFNTGCALYTDGATCIELDASGISLIKWNRMGERKIYQQRNWDNIQKELKI